MSNESSNVLSIPGSRGSFRYRPFEPQWPGFALRRRFGLAFGGIKSALERPRGWICGLAAVLLAIAVANIPLTDGTDQMAIAGYGALLVVAFLWFEWISPLAFAVIFVAADIAVIVFG